MEPNFHPPVCLQVDVIYALSQAWCTSQVGSATRMALWYMSLCEGPRRSCDAEAPGKNTGGMWVVQVTMTHFAADPHRDSHLILTLKLAIAFWYPALRVDYVA